uniref:EGF-like domain-containing protein n=1 Tax=Strix occidentalis caurina TaxID=311401 RepID=A0A8D0FVJ2_STROC
YCWIAYWFILISFHLTESGNLLLLVASRNQIVVDNITSQSHSIYSLIRDGRNIVAIDFDSVTDRIFWSDTTQDKIWSAFQNGTDRKIVSFAELFLIAVDWVGRNLYWTDFVLETIEVSKMDGSHRTVLISENITNPRGLVLDPRTDAHVMFWTDWGQNPRIEKASMDGKMRTVIINNKIYWPNGLSIDYPNKLLYFADAYLDYIDFCDYNGNNRRQVVASDLHPHALTVFEDFVYWSDRYTNRVIRANKWHGGNQTVMIYNIHQPLGLVAVHPVKQPNGNNNIGVCQQLCLPVPGGLFSCACATGFQLNPDNRTCSPYSSFVIVSMLSAIKGFRRNALHVDVHMPSGFIYWCDFSSTVSSQNAIRKIKPDGSYFRNVVTNGIGRNGIRGIAIDWVAGNLYFTNAFLTETFIEILRLNTTYRRVLLKTTIDMPRHIVVDPKNRYLFWADYGQNPKIERAFLDCTNRTVLVSEGIVTPRGLAIDHSNGYIYWVDDSLDMIARIQPDGGDVEIVRYGSRYPTPYGITVFENSMIWVDRNLKKVFQASKEPGSTDQPTVIRDNINWLRDVTIYNSHFQSRSPLDVNNNPCLDNNGGCSHLCFALPDVQTPKCGCAFGTLGSDGKRCSISTDDYLIFALENALRSIHLDPENHSPPFRTVNVLRTAVALDFDSINNRIYFTQSYPSGSGRISYVSIYSGIGSPTVVASGKYLGTPDGIAFDWINNRVYYSDYLNQTISSMAVDGSNRTVIARVPRPRAVVLDPCRGYMYWTDWSSNAKIERATLGGNFRTPIVSTNLVWPNGLTLDYEEQQLYWADANLYIERCTLTGTNREVIVSTALHPFAMTLFDQHIYWTDWNTRSIYRANKYDGSDQVVMIMNLPQRPMDIHVWAKSKQQQCTNPCNQFNGGCSHICAPAGSYICKCAPGYIREPDGKSCRQNSNISPYLIFSNRYYLRNLTADGQSYSLILQGLRNVVALDFDRVEKRLYWIDVGRKVIERMFLNGTNKEAVISDDVPNGEGIAVDWVGRKLYWVDAYKDCLYVSELDGRFRKKLVDRCVDANNTFCFQYPRAIVVHPKYGQIYWTDWADRAYIGRAGMDGKEKTVIISTKLEWPNGLTIDYTNDKLYWADAHLNYIEYSDLDGHHRHTVYDGTLPHPFAITIFEDTIYWTDWNTRTVEKGNKYDGSDRTVLVNTTHRPFDIHVYHPYRQPFGEKTFKFAFRGSAVVLRLVVKGPVCTQLLDVFSTKKTLFSLCRCIPIWWKCDGQRDCRDGSDEPPTCPHRYCPVGQFQCNDGNCTSPHFLCNTQPDCHDRSDEDPVLCGMLQLIKLSVLPVQNV